MRTEISLVRLSPERQDTMRHLTIMVGTLAALWLAPAAAQNERLAVKDWQVFVEPQFGTQVDYPADVFSHSGGQSERGIGERFRTPDSDAILEVYSLPKTRNTRRKAFCATTCRCRATHCNISASHRRSSPSPTCATV